MQLEDIASDKAHFDRPQMLVKHPLIVEDAGLFVDSLGGFPGPYSSYVLSTIGNSGILRLLGSIERPHFVQVIAYSSGRSLKISFVSRKKCIPC